jgi:phosphatidylserine/phosphatidylglycerophosphate/cardiolipin synthase-like enzyme
MKGNMLKAYKNRAVQCLAAIVLPALVAPSAFAKSAFADLASEAVQLARSHSATAPDTGMVEVAFSPNEGAQDLVLKSINASKKSIRMLAYSFTSAPVVSALLAAKKRGVDVQIVVDYKNNVSLDKSGKARAAMSALVNAGIPLRTINVYAIHHDKTICVDGLHTQLGSFNYSSAAEKSNSENVLVLWNNPKITAEYLRHWQRNWNQGAPYATQY